MPAYVRDRRAFDDDALRALRDAVVGSPFVGKSTLGGAFQESRGFAVTFTVSGRAAVVERFPFLAGYLERALDPARRLALHPFWRRPKVEERAPNAFYLNALFVPKGGRVGRHVDATLREPAGLDHAVPIAVSVAYLAVPRGARGGRLLLDDRGAPRGAVTPREGALVVFRGDLAHQVEPFTGGPDGGLRISLVTEQYALQDDAVARLPQMRVHSKAGFGAYLDDAATRERSFPVEE